MKSKKVYLASLKIRGYKNCTYTCFEPQEGLSALIGINGSGKTTVLSALHLLKSALTCDPRVYPDGESSEEKCSLHAIFIFEGKEINYKANISYKTGEGNKIEVKSTEGSWNADKYFDEKLGWIPLPTRFLTFGQRESRISLSRQSYERAMPITATQRLRYLG